MTIDDLKNWGADTDKGLERCMGNADLFLKLVGMTGVNDNFEKCEEALARNDLDAAFEAAHALKGVTGNLELTPIYEPVSELTEALPGRTGIDYSALYQKVKEEKEKLSALL